MDLTAALQAELDLAHMVTEGTIEGLTNEQLHFVPPGTAHSIAATYAHLLTGEDSFVQRVVRGVPPLLVGEWGSKMGLSAPIPTDATWAQWAATVRVDLPKLREYAKAVYAATTEYLSKASAEEMDRKVKLPFEGFGEMPVATVIAMMAQHNNNHTGEIAAIKGIQGLQGYPF
jgi:uncharacterized damage-inducible protein DinB